MLAPVDPLYRETPVPYGPVFVFASSAIAQFSGDQVVVAVLAYRLIAVVGLLVAAFGVHDLARGLGRDPVDALVLAFANPLVLLHLVSGAHNEAMMLAFLVTGVAVGRRPRWRLAGIALCALAAAIKLPAILAVAFLTWPWISESVPWRLRAARAAASGALTFAVIAAAGRLTGWGWGWVDALTATTPVDAYLSVTRLLGGGVSLLIGVDVAATLAVARLVGVLVAVATSLWLLFRRSRSWPLALAWSLVIWAVLHPTTQPWYLTWGLMLLAASSAGQRNRALVTSCAVGAFLVLPVGPQLGLLLLDRSGKASLALAAVLLAILTVNPPRPARPAAGGPRPRPGERGGPDPQRAGQHGPAGGRHRRRRPVASRWRWCSSTTATTARPTRWRRWRPRHRSRSGSWAARRRPVGAGWEGRWSTGSTHAAGSVAVVMDGDLQHPPAVIDRLVEALDQGHDLAVASRRVPGGVRGPGPHADPPGAVEGSRPGRRGPCSRHGWAGWPIPCRASSPCGWASVDLDRLSPDGFKILVELLATHPELVAGGDPVPVRGPAPGHVEGVHRPGRPLRGSPGRCQAADELGLGRGGPSAAGVPLGLTRMFGAQGVLATGIARRCPDSAPLNCT